MQWLAYVILLLRQDYITTALRVIENGLGLPIFMEEDIMFDYAILADDQKDALPTQVIKMLLASLETLVDNGYRWSLTTGQIPLVGAKVSQILRRT